MRYLAEKNVDIDDTKLFDRYQNFCKFMQRRLETDEVAFSELKAHEKWTKNLAQMVGAFTQPGP